MRSYRNGVFVKTTLRDISIEVAFQTNFPPVIVITPDADSLVEVNVGDLVEITVNATDPDPGQVLTLSASGGPIEDFFQEKATFHDSDMGCFFLENKLRIPAHRAIPNRF